MIVSPSCTATTLRRLRSAASKQGEEKGGEHGAEYSARRLERSMGRCRLGNPVYASQQRRKVVDNPTDRARRGDSVAWRGPHADRLREVPPKILRDRRKLSLSDVVTLTKSYPEPVGKGYLSRVERGLARVGFLKMVALSRAYDVSLDALGEKLSLDLEVAGAEERARITRREDAS